MQTFLPYADFHQSAAVLDNQRLNKQALEGWQILMTLLELDPQGNYRKPKGWVNHPAVKLWRGHETALFNYVSIMVAEWQSRGYKSTIGDKAAETMRVAYENALTGTEWVNPDWLYSDNIDAFTSAHRTALLCKKYEWYSQFGWPEDTGTAPETYDYVWSN